MKMSQKSNNTPTLYRNNEKGFVLVASLLILMILVVIGIAATNSTTIELQIAGNEKVTQQTFYAAESGWPVSMTWLDSQYPLPTINMGMDTSGPLTFLSAKSGNPDNLSFTTGITYKSEFFFLSANHVSGYSTDFKRFDYDITSGAIGLVSSIADIEVVAGKIEYVGGY